MVNRVEYGPQPNCKLSKITVAALATALGFLLLRSHPPIWNISQESSITHPPHHGACDTLGLPQNMRDIPLSQTAYTMDRGASVNFVMGILDMQPPVILALPRAFSDRINTISGKFLEAGNSADTIHRANSARSSDGVFIDVGGWVGDSSFPSAALGFDTYVFEPVRYNTDLMHFALTANKCHVSEHLVIVNALVGQSNGNSTIYVTARADNAAATKRQAVQYVGESVDDFEQDIEMIKLDSFFPPGTKAQNLKIDVQGNELYVLRGAERLLKENKGRLKVRFEYVEALLRASNTDPQELVHYMTSLGYKVISKGADIDME
jgi:FkbM family methyltransferase